jgi:hypothetical protein
VRGTSRTNEEPFSVTKIISGIEHFF